MSPTLFVINLEFRSSKFWRDLVTNTADGEKRNREKT